MVDFSFGLVASLVRMASSIGERVLPFFFPPKLVVIDSAYGHMKDGGVDRENYTLLVVLKFVNAGQKPLLVTGVQACLDGKAYQSMATSPRRRGVLTSKGWRILREPHEQVAEFPFQVRAANVEERVVFFRMPDLAEHCAPVKVTFKASFAYRMGTYASLEFKPEPVLPNK